MVHALFRDYVFTQIRSLTAGRDRRRRIVPVLSAIVMQLEPRVMLTSALPADIDQWVQSSQFPNAWYAAFDVMLPALEQAATGEDDAIADYNSLIESISSLYDFNWTNLSSQRQADLQNANDTFWNTVNTAESSLTSAYFSSLFANLDVTSNAFSDYSQIAQSLETDFDNQIWDELLNGGDGATLWTTMLNGEAAAWNQFIGIRQAAFATMITALDTAVAGWTQAVDPAFVDREESLATIISSTDQQSQLLNDSLESDLADADEQLQKDRLSVEANWNAAISNAQQAWYTTAANPSQFGGSTWAGPQDPNSDVVSNALLGLWDSIRNAGQSAFDLWESAEWATWRIIASRALANKPVASLLFGNSLQDNPPDLAFPAGHFIPTAIKNSPEFAAKVNEILHAHTSSGPGIYENASGIGIVFPSGDLMAGIHAATITYTLTLNANRTYSLSATLKDKYDFAMSWDYYKYNLWGVGLVVANNIAWADQHLHMIETYDWTATLSPVTGTW